MDLAKQSVNEARQSGIGFNTLDCAGSREFKAAEIHRDTPWISTRFHPRIVGETRPALDVDSPWCNRRCNANDATEQRETWNRRRGGGRAEWRSERCGFSRGQSVLIAYSGHLTNCLDCLSDVMAGLMKRRPCSMLFNGLNGGIRGWK